MSKHKTVLVFSPHADDAEIGVGGYIARTIAEGGRVIVAVASVGAIKFLHLNREVESKEREAELHASLNRLGVLKKDIHVLTHGYDSRMHDLPTGDMVALLDELQEQYKPDEVLIPLPSAHQDHRYCWDIGVAATRPSPAKHSPSLVAAYEYPLTFWGSGAERSTFHGGLYVNVTDYWKFKLEALSQYKTQMRDNSPIGLQGVEALASLRGLEAGVAKAELLHVLRMVVK